MSVIQTTGKKGTIAVKRLREQKLKNGLPFMINVAELSTNECYLEYPNGSIQLITVAHATREMSILRELTAKEANTLRQRFHFAAVN
jgi:hypothetical protein